MNEVADNHDAIIFAEEALVVDVQIFLHNLMEEKGMSRADLAKAMGVSRARVSQMLSDDCRNLTVRLLARATHALGERMEFDCDHFRRKREQKDAEVAGASANVISMWQKGKDIRASDVASCHADERLLNFVSSSYERKAAA